MRALGFSLLLLIAPCSILTRPQNGDVQVRLDTSVAEYNLLASGFADALAKTSKHFQFPIGIEWVKDHQALRDFNRTWKGDTVRQILGSIVEAYPGYLVQIDDGCVHVFRQDLLNDRRNFLNLRLPDFFEVRNEIGGFANQKLQSVVQNIVSPRNWPPGAGEAGSYTSGNVREKPLSVDLKGATVREALERLVDASEHKMWIVTFSDTSTLTHTGFYLTETLWHPRPFPDHDQPMWDFLAWDQYQPH